MCVYQKQAARKNATSFSSVVCSRKSQTTGNYLPLNPGATRFCSKSHLSYVRSVLKRGEILLKFVGLVKAIQLRLKVRIFTIAGKCCFLLFFLKILFIFFNISPVRASFQSLQNQSLYLLTFPESRQKPPCWNLLNVSFSRHAGSCFKLHAQNKTVDDRWTSWGAPFPVIPPVFNTTSVHSPVILRPLFFLVLFF